MVSVCSRSSMEKSQCANHPIALFQFELTVVAAVAYRIGMNSSGLIALSLGCCRLHGFVQMDAPNSLKSPLNALLHVIVSAVVSLKLSLQDPVYLHEILGSESVESHAELHELEYRGRPRPRPCMS